MKRKGNDELWDDIEVFTEKGARISNPKITITDRSGFLFGSAFCHRAELKDKTHVLLMYSKKGNAILFNFTQDSKAEGAFKLVHRGRTAFTTCRSFFTNYYLHPTEIAGHYKPSKKRMSKVGECWLIKLDEKLVK